MRVAALTGAGVVTLIITDLCVFQVDNPGEDGLTLLEMAPGVTIEELREKTEAEFRVGNAVPASAAPEQRAAS